MTSLHAARPTIYVILPAWNEAAVIHPTLLALVYAMHASGEAYHAVLVDDGSTDATIAEAERAGADSGGRLVLTVLRHDTNRGLGAGLRTGIEWCLDRASADDVLVTLDADNTHPPAMIPALVARVRAGCDVAIASRYAAGAEVHGVPGYRRFLSDGARVVFHHLYPIRGVQDYTCCFRAYRAPVLERARQLYGDQLCTARGFEAVMDLLLRLEPLDVRVEEIGFTLDYAGRVGASKMNVLRTIRSTVSLLLRRRWERLTRWRPEVIAARLAEMTPVAGARVGAGSFADARVEATPAPERKSA